MKKTLIIITTFCSLVACEKAIDNLPQDSSINKSNQRIAASSPVEFIYDKGRVSSIKMGNVPLLGDAVGTGGIYLIGSLDGSDAQGKSVSSKGATNGFMLPETLNTAIPRPPYSLAFTKMIIPCTFQLLLVQSLPTLKP